MKLLIAFAAFCLGSCAYDVSHPMPRLVGYGCEGSGGVLYADEEDHFPRCQRIEAYES